jgi:phage terminase large subunit
MLLLQMAAMVMLTATAAASPALDQRVARLLKPMTEAQDIALCSTAPEFGYMGRRFGGKSWVLDAKAAFYAQRYGPPHYPPARVFICREERAAMQQTTVLTMREEILGRELFDALYSASKDALHFPNGSTIVFEGLDRPKRVLGARYGFLGIDQAEQIDEDQFEIANSGCTQVGMPWTQTFCAFNPENPEHWAFQRYRPDEGDGFRTDSQNKQFAEVVHVKESDLMNVLSEEQRDRLDRLSGLWRDRLRLGKWVAFTGTVLDVWDSRVHIIDPPEAWAAWGGLPPPSWERYRGVDFGYNPDPYAVVWATRSPEGIWYVYRQEYRLKLTLDVQTARVLAIQNSERARLKAEAKRQDILARRAGERSDVWKESVNYIEPGVRYISASDHEAQHRAMFAKAGLRSFRANKDIWAGIETMRNLLDPGQPGGPRLFVVKGSLVERDRQLGELRRPTCLEEEIGRYLWKETKAASGARIMKDIPVDANNHALDALRYVLHTFQTRRTSFVADGDQT